MPELPEVETIQKTLERLVIGKQIQHVTVHWPNIIQEPDSIPQFIHLLQGERIRGMSRKGKFLLFHMDNHDLVSHLRMEGKYRVDQCDAPVKKHTHIILSFTDGLELRYNDVRKFGTMHLFPKDTAFTRKPLSQVAPDPLEEGFDMEEFHRKLKRTTRHIKACLLDQTLVSGLGNIYVDETLFRSRIHPLKKANTLTRKQVQHVKDEAAKTLTEAIAQGGTTIRSYTDTGGTMGMFQQTLYVYGKENEPCIVCGQPLLKIKAAGRGSHFCKQCQKK